MRYSKQRKHTPATDSTWLLGMLYVVEVRLVRAATREKVKHRILMVGCEAGDIERKLRWLFDAREFVEFSVTEVRKVKEKMHFLSTTITQESEPAAPIIEREEGSIVAPQQKTIVQELVEIEQRPRLYAVGLSTTMPAMSADHAVRKVGHALIRAGSEGSSHAGATLSADSTLTIEEIPFSSGFAKARDVSAEKNEARFVRG